MNHLGLCFFFLWFLVFLWLFAGFLLIFSKSFGFMFFSLGFLFFRVWLWYCWFSETPNWLTSSAFQPQLRASSHPAHARTWRKVSEIIWKTPVTEREVVLFGGLHQWRSWWESEGEWTAAAAAVALHARLTEKTCGYVYLQACVRGLKYIFHLTIIQLKYYHILVFLFILLPLLLRSLLRILMIYLYVIYKDKFLYVFSASIYLF